MKYIAPAAFGLCLLASPLARAAALPSGLADLVAKTLPAVVSVASTDPTHDHPDSPDQGGNEDGTSPAQPTAAPASPNSNPVSGSTIVPPPRAEQALGAGFIISPDGYILTNHHVIEGASEITVTLQDGNILPAKLIGQDKTADLALLKIDDGTKLPYLTFGDSHKLRVGDWVMAIGNPYGLGDSVSAGIVSALHRDIHEGSLDDFIQTDAAINRGNSGGPMIDLAGHVVGVDSAIYSPSGGSVGIGFAIPSSMAQAVADALRTTGKMQRGWLGLRTQSLTPALASTFGLPNSNGVMIGGVAEDGPSAKILQPGDVLLNLGNVPVNTPREMTILSAEIPAGHSIDATYWRDGSAHHASLTVALPPPATKATPLEPTIALTKIPALGIAVTSHPGDLGVLIAAIDPNGPAAHAGIEANNLIQAVGPDFVTTPGDLQDDIAQAAQTTPPHATLLTTTPTGPVWVNVPLKP